ncbi:hypothetical protein CYU10_000579 [Lactococcus lactis subsp. lactis]|uniref:Uncharacterized protein n=1 Tax=Lactococcus lactis subsp. lactis TaxID=1360 RepID=A0A2R7Y062_LACLL|nr:hypothetical protein CYU10_000579 [Lactococcus lactis subsp. lactis]
MKAESKSREKEFADLVGQKIWLVAELLGIELD